MIPYTKYVCVHFVKCVCVHLSHFMRFRDDEMKRETVESKTADGTWLPFKKTTVFLQ